MFKFRGACESGILVRTVGNDLSIRVNEVAFKVPNSFEARQTVKVLVDLKKSRVFLIFPNGKRRRLYPQKLFVGNLA